MSTTKSTSKRINIALIVISIGIFIYAFFIYDSKKPIRKLAIYGPKTYESKQGKTDTTFHVISDFQFIDQDGNTVTAANFNGSIYVTDFFFTNCRNICPVMSTQMERVYNAYKGNKEVKFLSHTVDPERDSVQELKAYAIKHYATADQWLFVTGDKKALYEIARKSYLLNADEGDGGAGDFIHTQNFALIDKDKRIRGFYDGTDTTEINHLIKDIQLLLAEYNYKNR